MNFGEYIRAARKSKKMTLNDLSTAVNISVVYASQIEAGKFQPSLEKFERIVKVLGLDLGEALDKSGRWPEFLERSAKSEPKIIQVTRNLFDTTGAMLPLTEDDWQFMIKEFEDRKKEHLRTEENELFTQSRSY